MKNKFREHYGQNFCLDIDQLPTQATDRVSRLVLFFSFVFGLMFCTLGSYLLDIRSLNGVTDFEQTISKSNIKIHSFISTEAFGILLLILGACMVIVSFFYLLRFKKVFFDGETVTVKDFPFFGKSHSFSESLSEFSGVRLRLKFCQYGLFSRNKCIIELYHKDTSKIVPLYISRNPKAIRTIWKNYALKLNLPPIHISEKGMVSHSVRNMDRCYADVVKKWNLPQNFLVHKQHSQDFVCKQKQGKKMIKTSHVIFDVYSTLNLTAIFLFTALLGYALFNHNIIVQHLSLNVTLVLYALFLTIIFYAYITLVVRDILIINNQKIVIFRKILGFAYQDASVAIPSLRGIDIIFTPTTGRYSLNIVTDKTTINLFSKLSPEDLRWIRGFLICEIMEA